MRRTHIFTAIAGLSVLVLSLVFTLFPRQATAANVANETYKMLSRMAIVVSGGNLAKNSNLARNNAFATDYYGYFSINNTPVCDIPVKLTIPNGNAVLTTGVLTVNAGGKHDSAHPLCPASITSKYNNVTITFGDIPGGTPGTTDDTKVNPTCETSPGAKGALTYILCGLYNVTADTTDWLFKNAIEPLLKTKPVPISNSGENKAVFEIWSALRLYGDIFLVIALLVIVFGQAIGGGAIEAYTARKALPRILMAAILINLSIYIVAFAVDATNIIGAGLGNLMTAPLQDKGLFNIQLSLGDQATGAAGAGIIAGAGLAGVISAGSLSAALPFLLLFAVLPMFIGLVIAFVVLLLRQAIIVLLVVFSPIAFALWCLPNTEKYFKQWWDLLFRTLILYPLTYSFASWLWQVKVLVAYGATP